MPKRASPSEPPPVLSVGDGFANLFSRSIQKGPINFPLGMESLYFVNVHNDPEVILGHIP